MCEKGHGALYLVVSNRRRRSESIIYIILCIYDVENNQALAQTHHAGVRQHACRLAFFWKGDR